MATLIKITVVMEAAVKATEADSGVSLCHHVRCFPDE